MLCTRSDVLQTVTSLAMASFVLSLTKNFVPLWAGLAEGSEAQDAKVVGALQSSRLVGPAGGLLVDMLFGVINCCASA